MGIKVSEEQMMLIDMATNLAMNVAFKIFTGYYRQIMEADSEALKKINAELKGKRHEQDEEIRGL